jgi:hypothetical protein
MASHSNQNVTSGDSTCVNIDQPEDVKFWSEHFQISQDELIKIVQRVGPQVKDIDCSLSGPRDAATNRQIESALSRGLESTQSDEQHNRG